MRRKKIVAEFIASLSVALLLLCGGGGTALAQSPPKQQKPYPKGEFIPKATPDAEGRRLTGEHHFGRGRTMFRLPPSVKNELDNNTPATEEER